MAETVASRLVGTSNNDLLVDAPGDTIIDALDGNDSIVAQFGDGNDIIDAGSGDDTAIGGEGNDIILGGDGTDFIRGVAGNDTLYGGAGSDTLIGEAGDDTIDGGEGNDFIYGDDLGDGVVFELKNNNILNGGAGDDFIVGGDGIDFLSGGDGTDVMNGGNGNDILYGGAGNDQFTGLTGDDQVYGEDGDDLVDGGVGNDRVFGGKGNDIILGTSVLNSQPTLDNGQIDTLIGNEGNDLFVLGAILPNGTSSVFYDDNDASTAGTGDYALIADFGTGGSATEKGEDTIQLVGLTENYSLVDAPPGLPTGTGIFYNNSATPELIGIVADVLPSDLSLTNTTQFTFLNQPPTPAQPEEPPQKPRIEVLASGLDSPRKLSFGSDGALYVAEAGRGGSGASIPSPSQPGAVLSYGATGAITRIQDGKVERSRNWTAFAGIARWWRCLWCP